MQQLPDWFPSAPPLYDIKRSYQENVLYGPFFQGKIPKRVLPPKEQWIDFLGYRIASPLGIPAGPLLTAKWVTLSAQLGFDVLTYKTIRSDEYPAHPVPNMVFVKTEGQLSSTDNDLTLHSSENVPSAIDDLAVTNSFGMPSQSRKFLMEDIPRAKASLSPGQVLIVSVVGTPSTGNFAEDFVAAALLAKDAGADIIEANFSCPNVEKSQGCLYMSPEIVLNLTTALAKAISPLPLILKMGIFPNADLMRKSLVAAAKGGAQAVCGINTISAKVVDEQGAPSLSANRWTSGICGGPIRQAALEFIRQAKMINDHDALGLTIIGCGGITEPCHFSHFLDAGATVAMSATGMMWDPYLATRIHQGNLCYQKSSS